LASGIEPNAANAFADSEPNPAKTFPGSLRRAPDLPPVYRTVITEKLDAGLSLQPIWQDLVDEYGYGASYESVKRFVRTIAPTLDAATREWRRPWVFRMTLGHCRHGYEEAVWDQKLETLLRLPRARVSRLRGRPACRVARQFESGGRPRLLVRPRSPRRHLAFAAHWACTPLPTQPRRPRKKGKQEAQWRVC